MREIREEKERKGNKLKERERGEGDEEKVDKGIRAYFSLLSAFINAPTTLRVV